VPTAGVATDPGDESVGVADAVFVGVADPVSVGGGLLVAGPVGGAEVLDAGAEKDVLVDGDCVGPEDRFALVVGRTERVA
jgi:hypothetical protein